MITKQQAATLWAFDYQIKCVAGTVFNIHTVNQESLSCDCELGYSQDVEVKFNEVGTQYFILAKPLTDLWFDKSALVDLFTIAFGGCYDEKNLSLKAGNSIKISNSYEQLTIYPEPLSFLAHALGEEGENWNPPIKIDLLYSKINELHFDINLPKEAVKHIM